MTVVPESEVAKTIRFSVAVGLVSKSHTVAGLARVASR